jgi:hypothetical protein
MLFAIFPMYPMNKIFFLKNLIEKVCCKKQKKVWIKNINVKFLHVLAPLIQMNLGFVLLCTTNDD